MRSIAARSLSLAALSALSLASAAARADDREWINPAGGTFSDPMNWLGGISPGATDKIIFDTVGEFPVVFSSDAMTSQLTVRGGSLPTFTLSGKTYQPTGIVVGDDSSSSRMTVAGGTFNSSGLNWVGPQSGGFGELVVSGANTEVYLSNLRVGGSSSSIAGVGSVRVEGGAQFNASQVFLGNQSGGAATFIVDGAGTKAFLAELSINPVVVQGLVDIGVTNGGQLTTQGISGAVYTQLSIRAEGPGSILQALGQNGGTINIANRTAAGEFRVADGASASTVSMKLMGQDAEGRLANGGVAGIGSNLSLHSLTLGDQDSDANFTVSDGGVLEFIEGIGPNMKVNSPIGGVGSFTVTGAGSRVDVSPAGLLQFGTRPDTFSRLRILDGAVITGSSSNQPPGFVVEVGFGEMEIRGTGSALLGANPQQRFALLIGYTDVPQETIGSARLIVAGGGRVFSPSDGNCCTYGTFLVSGEIRGDGVLGEVVGCFGGVVRPGDPHGALTIEGSYTQYSPAALEIELINAERNEAPDRLIVTGTATLAGTLQVRMVDGYDPPIGAIFPAISAGSIVGTFDHIDAPLTNNKVARVEYLPDAVNIRIALQGDVNSDGVTNALDLSALFGAWGTSDPSADLNADGIVNSQDLALLLGAWTY